MRTSRFLVAAAAAFVVSVLVAAPASAGLVQRLTLTFEDELELLPISFDLAFPRLAGTCDSADLLDGAFEDCDTDGPTVHLQPGLLTGFLISGRNGRSASSWLSMPSSAAPATRCLPGSSA